MLNHDFEVHQQRYYLTPAGWSAVQPRPDEIVEIWELDIYQPTGWSREYHDWTCMWATNRTQWSPDVREALRESYPFPDLRRHGIRSVINFGIPLGADIEVFAGGYGVATA